VAFGYTLLSNSALLGSFVEFIGCPQLGFRRVLCKYGWISKGEAETLKGKLNRFAATMVG